MVHAVENFGFPTFTVDQTGGVEKYRRLKLKTATTVEYAGAGEMGIGTARGNALDGETVAIRPYTSDGVHILIASAAVAAGASLYPTANGKFDDAGTGSVFFTSKTAASGDGSQFEAIPDPVLSTTAATVSIADAGSLITATDVEAALQEVFQHIQSIQHFIPIPLTSWMIGDGTNTVSFGGPATDPILDMTNGDTDSALRFAWAAASVVPIITQVPLPPILDVSKDIVIHLWLGKDADVDTVTLSSDVYFNVGDTKVEDVTATIAQTAAEVIITIAAADVPAGAQTMTIELTPSAHASDALYMYASWLEHAGLTLTS